jgi:hypothetical protein
VETTADVGPQGIFYILVGKPKVKPFWIEMSTTPSFHLGMIRVIPIGHGGQVMLIAVQAADIFRGAPAGTSDTRANLWGRIQNEVLFDFDDMTPTVAEVVEVAEPGTRGAVEIEQTHLALIKDARAIVETVTVQLIGIAEP